MRSFHAPLARLALRGSAALLAGWLLVSVAPPCRAADGAPESAGNAQDWGRQGAAAYEAGNHAEAIEHFDRAFALLPAPSLQLWAARSCVKLGRLLEAQRRYRETVSLSDQIGDPAVQRSAQQEARKELEELPRHIPLLGVRIVGSAGQPARLTLDDHPFESAPGQLTPVDPGHHVLVGSDGQQRTSVSVELAAGERRELVLDLSAPASEPSAAAPGSANPPPMTTASSAKAWRTAGWLGVGAGGAVLLTGIITRSVAQSRYDALQRQPGCTRTTCPPAAGGSVDSYESMRSVSLVTTVSGAVLAAAGAGLVLFGPKESEGGGLAVAPGAVTWSGHF